MSKDPAFLFYSNDFLTGTFTMSDEQVGRYIRLLCLQHQKRILTEKDMLNICKGYDEEVFSKFVKTDEGFFNERLLEESDKRKSFADSRRLNRMNKTKPITKDAKPKKEKSKQKDVLVFPFTSKEFMLVWDKLCEQPKWNKKNTTSLQMTLKKLSKYSESDAIEMMENSIAGNWQGIFELKNNNNGTTKNNQQLRTSVQDAFNKRFS